MKVSTILVSSKYLNKAQENKKIKLKKMKSLMDHLGNFRCQIQEQNDLTLILIFLNKYKKNQIYNNLQTREEIEKLQKN